MTSLDTTTHGEGQERPWGRMALSALLFLGGAWCLTNTAAMNFSAGVQSADSWLGKWVQPSSTLAVDVMVALLAAVVFSLLAMGTFRSMVSGLLLGVVLLGFAGFSVKNSLAFGMQERVEKSMRVKANADAVTDAVRSENEFAKQAHESHVAWLQSQYRAAKYRSDKDRLLEEIREASKQHFDVKVEVVDTVMGDPEAEAMAGLLGWSMETYILANQLALAMLLVIGKVLGFGLAASLWPRPVGPSASEAEETMHAETITDDEPVLEDVPALSPEPSWGTISVTSSDLGALEAPERGKRSSPCRDTAEIGFARRRRAVDTFITSEMVRTSQTREGLTADAVFRAYSAWARENEPDCQITQVVFSRLCADLDVPKVRRRGLIRYGLLPAYSGASTAIAA